MTDVSCRSMPSRRAPLVTGLMFRSRPIGTRHTSSSNVSDLRPIVANCLVALPLDIHSHYATYGCQYGLIERPTHRNTPLDQAKFEVCAHMIADLSEAGYGVSLVSEFKYGYAVESNVMR